MLLVVVVVAILIVAVVLMVVRFAAGIDAIATTFTRIGRRSCRGNRRSCAVANVFDVVIAVATVVVIATTTTATAAIVGSCFAFGFISPTLGDSRWRKEHCLVGGIRELYLPHSSL